MRTREDLRTHAHIPTHTALRGDIAEANPLLNIINIPVSA